LDKYNRSVIPDYKKGVSSWDKSRGFNIVMPWSTEEDMDYITIPITYSFLWIKSALNTGIDVVNGEDIDTVKAAWDIASSIWEGYNPLGGQGSTTIVPSVARPGVEIAANVSGLGRPIMPERRGPDDIKYWKSTRKSLLGRAAIAGIKKAQESLGIEVSPESLLYFYRQMSGGPGRLAAKMTNTLSSAVEGEMPQVRDIPFVSRFARNVPEERFGKEEERELIEKLKNEKYRRDFYRSEELGDLVDTLGDDYELVLPFIEKQEPNKIKRITGKTVKLLKVKGMPSAGWYKTLKSLPPEVRFPIWERKFNMMKTQEKRDKMLESAMIYGGILNKAFFYEQAKKEIED
jgi:hypothetical protein